MNEKHFFVSSQKHSMVEDLATSTSHSKERVKENQPTGPVRFVISCSFSL